MARIWRCKETGKRIENNKCPGQGWVLVRRAGITKVKAKCPDCGAERLILESTQRGMNFNPQCLSCSRIAKNQAKVEANFRPVKDRFCLKCERVFKPTIANWFVCLHCDTQNKNPSRYSSIEEEWATFG